MEPTLVELVEHGVSRAKPLLRTVTVGSTDTLLVPANPRRRGLVINNNDPASPVSLGVNAAAVAGNGLQLNSTFNSLQVWDHDWGWLARAEWRAVATLTGTAPGPNVPFSRVAAAASGAAVGDVISFTVPTGSSGVLQSASANNFTNAPTVQLQLVRGATTVVIDSITAATLDSRLELALNAGDVVKWRVTTGVAASSFDVTLSGYTNVLAGAAPANVQVGVIELEG